MKAPFLLFIAFMAGTIVFGVSFDNHNSKWAVISIVGLAIVVLLALVLVGPKYRKYTRQQANL